MSTEWRPIEDNDGSLTVGLVTFDPTGLPESVNLAITAQNREELVNIINVIRSAVKSCDPLQLRGSGCEVIRE